MALSWGERLVGLLSRNSLPDGEALIFPRCQAIHTFGMRFPIDVAFVDAGGQVIALHARIRPWRMTAPLWSAWAAVEMNAGSFDRAGIKVGQHISIYIANTYEEHNSTKSP